MAQEANEEGFHDLTEQFRGVGAIEKAHEERYRSLLKNVETRSQHDQKMEHISEGKSVMHIHFCAEHMSAMVKTGIPLALQSILFPIANSIVQVSVNGMGTDSIATWGICDKMNLLIWLIADAMSPALEETKQHWLEKVNVSFKAGSRDFDNLMNWVCFQPFLRRLFGCSFLTTTMAETAEAGGICGRTARHCSAWTLREWGK